MAKNTSKKSNWSAPYPGTRYNPPPAGSNGTESRTSVSDNAHAKKLLASDFSNRRTKDDPFRS